uniref:F-box domain-containing protein n=1 Tax=Tetranychus urticae TaxID=32264 RepID=T1L5M2_TETUR
MLINELPDDCLLTIFDYIKDLQDLINCFKVCVKWSNVIVGRTRRVKYLFNQSYYSPDYVCNYVNRPIDVTCLSKLFPNLRIADLFHISNVLRSNEAMIIRTPTKDIDKLIRDSESLKGIIFPCNYYLDFELMPEIANLEMLSTGYLSPKISGIYENVKQLHLYDCNLGLFESIAHCFPNLERIKIYVADDGKDYRPDHPAMANLKIFEMAFYSFDRPRDISCSFLAMDSCPALQSAHIRIDCSRIVFNDAIKHANLQNLVIQFLEPIEWDKLRKQMSKYPNLKHLALRDTSLEDEHIEQLIFILPKLTLLDIRESRGVTREAADHVRDYCKHFGRSIKFLSAEGRHGEWPHISLNIYGSNKICRGFDFMEHCFFKNFDHLPHFLDPIDD